jgi:hypothetical protein
MMPWTTVTPIRAFAPFLGWKYGSKIRSRVAASFRIHNADFQQYMLPHSNPRAHSCNLDLQPHQAILLCADCSMAWLHSSKIHHHLVNMVESPLPVG